MTTLDSYSTRYTCAALTRADGILEVRLHSGGGPLVWGSKPHSELGELFHDIRADRENRIVIITGTGGSFIAESDPIDLSRFGSPLDFDKSFFKGRDLVDNMLAIEVPVIAAVNGPAHVHPEIALLSDIVICTHSSTFQDAPHFSKGLVPGDGAAIAWLHLLGPTRARYFLLTGQILSAQQAIDFGIVNEVVGADHLLPRARELARQLAETSDITLRYTRFLFTREWKRISQSDLALGLMMAGANLMQLKADAAAAQAEEK